jgi:hypothetical protein
MPPLVLYGRTLFEKLIKESQERMAKLQESKEPVSGMVDEFGSRVTTEILVRRLAIERDISVYEAAEMYCEINNLSREQWNGPPHWIKSEYDDIEF